MNSVNGYVGLCGGAQHRAEGAVQHRDAEGMQARRIVLDEIFDVEAALEILLSTHRRGTSG